MPKHCHYTTVCDTHRQDCNVKLKMRPYHLSLLTTQTFPWGSKGCDFCPFSSVFHCFSPLHLQRATVANISVDNKFHRDLYVVCCSESWALFCWSSLLQILFGAVFMMATSGLRCIYYSVNDVHLLEKVTTCWSKWQLQWSHVGTQITVTGRFGLLLFWWFKGKNSDCKE